MTRVLAKSARKRPQLGRHSVTWDGVALHWDAAESGGIRSARRARILAWPGKLILPGRRPVRNAGVRLGLRSDHSRHGLSVSEVGPSVFIRTPNRSGSELWRQFCWRATSTLALDESPGRNTRRTRLAWSTLAHADGSCRPTRVFSEEVRRGRPPACASVPTGAVSSVQGRGA